MGTPSIQVMVPPPVIAPRGAMWAASLAAGLLRLGRSGGALWHTLEQIGQRRAARELLALAQRCESYDEPLARQLRAAAQHNTTSAIGGAR